MTTLSWRFSRWREEEREREREREEKIMPSLMATSLRWRMHSDRTKRGGVGGADMEKGGGIWAPCAQKGFYQFQLILLIINEFVENYCHRRILACGRGNSFCKITYWLQMFIIPSEYLIFGGKSAEGKEFFQVWEEERERKREQNAINSVHYVLPAMHKGSMHFARTN
jgi:hypothetical protein